MGEQLSEGFTFLPNSAIEADKWQTDAATWADSQRANVAQMWADSQRAQADAMASDIAQAANVVPEAVPATSAPPDWVPAPQQQPAVSGPQNAQSVPTSQAPWVAPQPQAQPAPEPPAPEQQAPQPNDQGIVQTVGNALGNAGQAIGNVVQDVVQAAPQVLGQQPTSAVPTTADISNPTQHGGSPSMGLGDIYRIAMEQGLGEEGAKVATAIAQTEGGLNGAAGDGGKSRGPFQFYGDVNNPGQLNNYAKQLGMSIQQAGEYVSQHPGDAAAWALRQGGYLGDAIRRGIEKGLTGSELATYAQNPRDYHDWGDPGGQVSVSPERAGQNYQAIWASGTPASLPVAAVGDFLGNAGKAVGGVLGNAGQAIGDTLGNAGQITGNAWDRANPPQVIGNAAQDVGNAVVDVAHTQVPLPSLADVAGGVAGFPGAALGVEGQVIGGGLGIAGNMAGELVNAGERNLRVGPAYDQQLADIQASLSPAQFDQIRQTWMAAGRPTTKMSGNDKWAQEGRAPTDQEIVKTLAMNQTTSQGMQDIMALAMPLGMGGGLGKAGVNVAGKLPYSESPTGQAMAKMAAQGDKLSQAPGLRARMDAIGEGFTNLATDRQVALANFQQQAAKAKGAPLNADEMAYELSRLNPDMAAKVYIDEGLKPAIQAMGDIPNGQRMLHDYLIHMDNIDVAAAMGQKAEKQVLARDLGTAAGTAEARSSQARAAALGRLEDQNAIAASEFKAEGAPTPSRYRVQQATDAAQSAQDRLQVNTAASEAARAQKATATGAEVAANRSFSGGIKVADSVQGIADMQVELGPRAFAQVQSAAQQVTDFGHQLLQRQVDSGVITQDLADELTKRYPNYMPTKIVDYQRDPARIQVGKSLSLRDTGLRQNTLEGTTKAREDPLASMVRLAYDSEAMARKNEAFNAVVRLRDLIPGMDQQIRAVPSTYTNKVGETGLTGFVNGVRQNYVVPKDLEAAVKNESMAPVPGLSTAMSLYKSLLTSRNPNFLASNALNDAGTYLIRESSRMGGPQNLPAVVSELVKAYGDAFQGLLQGEFKGNTAGYLKRGGGMFGFFQGTPGQARATVEELARRNAFTINNRGDLLAFVKGIATLEPVQSIGERIELAPRVASEQLALKRGENAVAATIKGRTVTMDFAQGGTVARFFNQFIPFFNVGVQAVAQPVRAYRENPRGFLATGIGLIAAPVVAAEAWNRSDPQRAKDYADVPNYVKDQGVVIMLPGQAPVDATGNRRPQLVLLKLREYAPIAAIARGAAQAAIGDNTRDWASLLGGGLGAISPISANDSAGFFTSFLPPGISTGAQLGLNKDLFTGSMIATQRHNESAGAASKAIAGVTGAQPSQVDFFVRDLTGGPGAGALAASNLAVGKPNTGGLAEVPVVGGFAGRLIKGSTGQQLDNAQANMLAPDLDKTLKASGVTASVNPVSSTINGIPLTMAEETAYQQITNSLLDAPLRDEVSTAEWAAYTPDERNKVVLYFLDKARTQAKQQVLQSIDDNEIDRRLAAAKP